MNELIKNLLKLQTLEFEETVEGETEETVRKLRDRIPKPILGHYDRLTARGKRGVAIVRHRVCTGCHMQIPVATVNILLRDEDIQMCDNCGRYLCLPAVPEEALAQAGDLEEKELFAPTGK
jgi:predicted  nucleic acid-binding Zn-ribbon protein